MNFKLSFTIINIILILFLPITTNAWEEQDFEIFDVHDAITKLKGSNATFYSVLNTDPSASVDTLNKAYRKLSLEIHPDKTTNKNDRELYTQVNLIINMLRDTKIRSRYDYFLKVGVPKWRGTGYYYSRYRPNIRTVLIIIIIGICSMQILLSWTSYFTQKYRINSVKKEMDELTYQEVRKILRKENKDITKEMFRNSTPSEILLNNSEYIEFEEVKKPNLKNIIIIQLPVSIIKGIINAPKFISQAIKEYKEYKEKEKMEKENESGEEEDENNENNEENNENNNENSPNQQKKKKRVNRKKMVNGQNQTPEQIERRRILKEKNEEEKERRKKIREEASHNNINPFSGQNPLLSTPLPKPKENNENGEEDESDEENNESKEEVEELKTGPWDKDEYATLVRLSKKYPVGTPGRWVRIGMEMKRSVDEVADNVKLLKTNPRLAMGIVQ